MFSFLAARMAVGRRGLELASPPPMRAAMVISRITRVKTRPRFASVAAFLCLMVAHFECPDMTLTLFCFSGPELAGVFGVRDPDLSGVNIAELSPARLLTLHVVSARRSQFV